MNTLNPSAVCTVTDAPDVCMTVPCFTSVTVTGVTVVRVVMVAVPFMPDFSSCTDNCLPLTVKRKSSGTVSSFMPSGRLTTTQLPSTARMLKVFVSDDDVVVWARDTTAVEQTIAAARMIRLVARFMGLSPFPNASQDHSDAKEQDTATNRQPTQRTRSGQAAAGPADRLPLVRTTIRI